MKKLSCHILAASIALLFAVVSSCLAMTNGYAQEAVEPVRTSNPQTIQSNPDQKQDSPVLTLTLLDEDGYPVAGVLVSAMEGALVGKERAQARTDDSGKAVFKDLISGTYYFYANITAIRSHSGYELPAMIRQYKTSRSYYISESKYFDLRSNVEYTSIIKRGEFIWFETYHDYYRASGIVVISKKMGIQQIIPVASTDFMQIYLPMHRFYEIATIKNNAFDAWVFEFYSHKGLRLELL